MSERLTTKKELEIAERALRYYANPENWGPDSWNMLAVIAGSDYGQGGAVARRALKRLARPASPEPKKGGGV